MDNNVLKLFPAHLVRVDDSSVEGAEHCPLFVIKQLEQAFLSMKNKKAPGIPTPARSNARCSQRLPEGGHFSFPVESGEALFNKGKGTLSCHLQTGHFLCFTRPGKCLKSWSRVESLKRYILPEIYPQDSSVSQQGDLQWMLSCKSWIMFIEQRTTAAELNG